MQKQMTILITQHKIPLIKNLRNRQDDDKQMDDIVNQLQLTHFRTN